MEQERYNWLTIEAEPETIGVACEQAAILVIDMQNAFVKPGGYLDIAGKDLAAVTKIIQPCKDIIQKARTQRIMLIFVTMVCNPALGDTGTQDSPHARKSGAMRLLSENPHFRDKFYIEDTWGAGIIEELKPQSGDLVVKKRKYNAFMETNLEPILRTRGIRFLLFVGTATNICVESTIRHAFLLDFFPILVSDAVSHVGPDILHEATILNVQSNFGWVTDSKRLLKAMNNPSVCLCPSDL
jgi:ureidoacrylate peracid hydrolase